MPVLREKISSLNPLDLISNFLISIDEYLSKRPSLVSAIFLTIFLNYKNFLNTPIDTLLYTFITIFLFIKIIKQFYDNIFEKYAAKLNYSFNIKNLILGLFLIIWTNGYFVFSDILNYRIKFRTKEIPYLNKNFFDKMIRVGLKSEADIRLIIIYVFLFITGIFYSLNSIYSFFIFDVLYRLSFFTLLNSIIPFSSFFALLNLNVLGKYNQYISNKKKSLGSGYMYPETGAMRIFLGSRRRYIFSVIFISSFLILIGYNANIYDSYVTSAIFAIIIFAFYLTNIEFDSIKKSVVK